MLTHLDLFSGIGGFSLAAQWAGFRTVGFCEREPYAQQVIKERFGAVLADAAITGPLSGAHSGVYQRQADARTWNEQSERPRLHGDIFTLNGADYDGVDLLTGGFPCQPFSVAGKRLGAADDRAIWPQMLRVINEARPAWVLGENVAGIVTMELDNVLSDLEAIGYAARPLVIPACAVDAKHRRDRVWIVAHSERGASGQGRAEWGGETGPGSRDESSGPSEDVADAAGGTRQREAQRQGGHTAQRDQDVANAYVSGLEGVPGKGCDVQQREEPNDQWIAGCREVLADANSQRRRGGAADGKYASDARKSSCAWQDESDWFAESGMGRVAHGIPHRSHRLRGLGNAIVPQVAFQIIQAIRSQIEP